MKREHGKLIHSLNNSSPIQTFTVGSGVSPDQPCCKMQHRSRAVRYKP